MHFQCQYFFNFFIRYTFRYFSLLQDHLLPQVTYFLFHNMRDKDGEPIVSQINFTALINTDGHVGNSIDPRIMNLVKRKRCATRMVEIMCSENGISRKSHCCRIYVELGRWQWFDFRFFPNSVQLEKFMASKKGEWVSYLP